MVSKLPPPQLCEIKVTVMAAQVQLVTTPIAHDMSAYIYLLASPNNILLVAPQSLQKMDMIGQNDPYTQVSVGGAATATGAAFTTVNHHAASTTQRSSAAGNARI